MTKNLKYIFLSITLLFFGNEVVSQEIDGIAAILEEHIILKSSIEGQYQQAMSQGEFMPMDAKCLILDNLLLDKLFLAQAEKDSVYIGEDEIDNELNRRMNVFINMFGSEDKLEEYYGKSAFELKEEFRKDVRQQMLSERMKSTIFKNLDISPKEVQTFYNEIPKDSLPFFNAEVEIGQIVIFSKPTLKQKNEAKERAKKIRQDILDGSDFSFQALLYSDDPGSSANGGELGWVERGSFVPEFEAVAYRLEQDEISDIVETDFGFHVIQLLDKKGSRIKARHVLITPKMDNSNSLEASKSLAEIKKKIEKGDLNYQKAVSLHSEDIQSKNSGGLLTNPKTGNSFFEMNTLEGDIALALDNKVPGDFSKILPFKSPRGKDGFRIIYLKSETPAHKASIETDYSKIKAVAKQAKQAKAITEWVEDKSRSVYVKLNNTYDNCEALDKWK